MIDLFVSYQLSSKRDLDFVDVIAKAIHKKKFGCGYLFSTRKRDVHFTFRSEKDADKAYDTIRKKFRGVKCQF
jgi:hypothetical protein